MILTTLAATGALAACGGNSTPAPAQPESVLLTAAHLAGSESLRFDMNLSETLSASGAAGQSLGALADQPISLTMHADVQSSTAVQATVRATVEGRSIDVQAILAGGKAYVSSNGGASFSGISVAQLPSNQYGVASALQYLDSIGSVTDDGAATTDGIPTERYHATLDPQKMAAILHTMFSRFNSPTFTALASALQFIGGSLDVTIDHTGHLVTETGSFAASVDLGALDSSLTGSLLTVSATFSAHFYDYGAAITVRAPANVTGTTTLP